MATTSPTTSLRWLWANGSLTIVMFAIFIVCWLGLLFAGWCTHNQELQDHNVAQLSLGQYVRSGHLWEATTENWEGEFLPMALFTLLTAKTCAERIAGVEGTGRRPRAPSITPTIRRGQRTAGQSFAGFFAIR